MDIKVKELVNSALSNIQNMVDANTVTGTPIVLDSGVTIIPVSKVSCAFAAGGSDLPPEHRLPALCPFPASGRL